MEVGVRRRVDFEKIELITFMNFKRGCKYIRIDRREKGVLIDFRRVENVNVGKFLGFDRRMFKDRTIFFRKVGFFDSGDILI